MKKYFIGIDFSKEKFDASIVMNGNLVDYSHRVFDNNSNGCKELLLWIACETASKKDEWLVCGENTGLYSMEVSEYLVDNGVFMWLEDPVQVHHCQGARREKTDESDSFEIAKYACRYQDKARLYRPLTKKHRHLKALFSYRTRLVNIRTALAQAAKEQRSIISRDTVTRLISESTKSIVSRINVEIKKVESQMVEIIQSEEDMNRNFLLVNSVKGIGFVNAASIIILTGNFTTITDPRKFACYSGMAPFERSSGKSVYKGVHTSKMAHASMKALLTEAARSAINFNPEMKAYYLRKIAEGKPSRVVVNNVRNKLIHRVFAVVRDQVCYSLDYRYVS